VRDDDATAGAHGVGGLHLQQDRFVGQAVETVSTHTGVEQRLRQCEAAVQLGLRGVEGRVEARHLRHALEGAARRKHAGQVVRLVQRRQRHQRFDAGQHGVVDHGGRAELPAAVHDAVADGADAQIAFVQALQHLIERFSVRGGAALAQADAFDLPAEHGAGV
jgi:hypothetical protein